MADLAPAYDSQVRFVSFRPWPFPLPAFEAPAVLRGAQEPPCDVLLLDSICAGYVGPWLLRHRPHLPLAAVLHQPPGGIDSDGVRRKVQQVLDNVAYQRAEVLVLASDALRAEVPSRVLRGREVVVVPPGRDVAGDITDVGDLRRGRRCALLCVGNWVPRKGILDLLEAFARLPQEAATLHLVGSADTDPAYGQLVGARLALRDVAERVVVHGPVERASVAGFYAAADVFVLASTREPYGTVYGEAMAAGLPVVGWDAGNLPYLARHEEHGLIVPPGDIGALSAALRRLCDDESLRVRLAASAREAGRSFPTWQESAARLFGVLTAAARRPR